MCVRGESDVWVKLVCEPDHDSSPLPNAMSSTLECVVCVWLFVVQVAMATGKAYAEEIEAIFFETSAKEGTNIHELFHAIGERLSHTCSFKYSEC